MDLRVEYRCILDQQPSALVIPLKTVLQSKNVGGLKMVLQELLAVPASEISAFLNGTPLMEDDVPLKQLYLRENDHFCVEFSGIGSLATMKQLITELETFRGLTTCSKQQDTVHLSKCNTAFLNCQSYSQIDHAIIRLCSLFLPWDTSSTTVNKQFFVQQGGADLFIDIFKFSTKVFVDDRESGLLSTTVHAYANYQLVLMVLCLRLLWTFAETKADAQLMLSKGAEQLVLYALSLDPDSCSYVRGCHDDSISKNIANVNQEAVGCLAGFQTLTTPKCAVHIQKYKPSYCVSNEELIYKVLWLAETESVVQEHTAKTGLVLRKLLIMINRKRKMTILHYPLSSSQLAAASLFFCTFNKNSLKYLVQKGVHYQVMKVLQQLLENISGDLMLKFYCVLFLGKLRASEIKCLTSNDGAAQAIDCLIERFLGRHKPQEIQSWNEQTSCHWKTLVPLVEMMFAGGKYCICNDGLLDGDASAWIYGSSKYECNADKTENREPVQKDVRTQDSFVLKHTAYCEAALYEQIDDIMISCQSKNTSCQCVERLWCASSRTDSKISWPGSHATQRLGLFTLECLMPVTNNCYLLIQENLLPYVVALGWQLQSPERLALKKTLHYVKNVKSTWSPPSLKVIVSSVFARRDGFKVGETQVKINPTFFI